jgi:RNA polymerase sigma-70 factor (ECF subfamily)
LRHGWREGRVPDRLEKPEYVVDRIRSPEAEATQSQRIQHLLAAIHMLPLSLRSVITLRLEGLSHREIAEIMGLSVNNVMVRASRARSRLKELLSTTSDVSHDY